MCSIVYIVDGILFIWSTRWQFIYTICTLSIANTYLVWRVYISLLWRSICHCHHNIAVHSNIHESIYFFLLCFERFFFFFFLLSTNVCILVWQIRDPINIWIVYRKYKKYKLYMHTNKSILCTWCWQFMCLSACYRRVGWCAFCRAPRISTVLCINTRGTNGRFATAQTNETLWNDLNDF